MKKTVDPKVVIVVIAVVVIIAAFFFAKKARTPRAAAMSRGGISIEGGRRVEPPADRGRGRRGGPRAR